MKIIPCIQLLPVVIGLSVLAIPLMSAAPAAPKAAAEKVAVPTDKKVVEKKETAAQKKARETLEVALAQYDMNLNGKLDADEIAIQDADKKKAAAEKRRATLAKKKADEAAAKVTAPAKPSSGN